MKWCLQNLCDNLKDPNYQRVEALISSYPKVRYPSMAPMKRMCAVIGLTANSIKVTGSNGKGSVMAMLGAIFDSLKLDSLRFTSPHFLCYNERFLRAGNILSNEDLDMTTRWVLSFIEADSNEEPYGWFEVLTGIAFRHCQQEQIPHLILEAGIGGRDDPTRLAPGNIVGLTSLDLEHTDLLGESLLEIAKNKMDLCPPGGLLVLNRLKPEVPLQAIRDYARIRKLELVEVAEVCKVEKVTFTQAGMQAQLQIEDLYFDQLHINLFGQFQVDNACLAILLARKYLARHCPTLSQAQFKHAVTKGLAEMLWPGRAEVLCQEPLIIVDVGHTPHAVASFMADLPKQLNGKKVLLVIGISYNKQVEGILKKALPFAQEVLPTSAVYRGSEPKTIEDTSRRLAPDKMVHPGLPSEKAFTLAENLAKSQDMAIVVVGSLFLAVEAMVFFAKTK